MTDTQAEGWRHPERHLARRVERRSAAELMNLLTFDALIRTYGMDADEPTDLLLPIGQPDAVERLAQLGREVRPRGSGHFHG